MLEVSSKVLEKLVNNRLVDHLKKCALYSDFQSKAQIFKQLYQIELLGLLTGLVLLEL